MKVILIAGKAMSGKDFTANLIKEELESQGKKVMITHYGDLLKYICFKFFNWNNEKDEKGRELLQQIGTQKIRSQRPDYWVDFIQSILNLFEDEWQYILIPDTRFPNEVNSFKKSKWDTMSVRVIRDGFVSTLNEEQLKHESEIALDNYEFDYYINNDGTLEGLKNEVSKLVTII